MGRFLLLAILWALNSPQLHAQSPFQFREAYLLENRISVERAGEEYSPSHSEESESRMVRCMVNCQPGQASPREDINNYRSRRWLDLLQETDKFRRMGGIGLAEKQYIDMVAMLRKAQGPATSDVALMLDHLAEFYLEQRNFDRAYETFSEALDVRRKTIEALTQRTNDAQAQAREASLTLYALNADASNAGLALVVCRMHLADLLTRLGQLDLAKGDLDRANQRLAEAVEISNEKHGFHRYVSGLYAIYFQSLVMEKQGKWQQAESLWQQTVQVRETLQSSRAYWDAMKEMAAFYARHGEFHKAAEIAHQIDAGTANRQLSPELPMPFPLDSRYRTAREDAYDRESETAMNEIEAVDKWRADGPDAAAAMLKDPQDRNTVVLGSIFDRSSDSERTKLLAWWEQRVFLHISILLDGAPPQERINHAYELLSNVKGRYLASIGETNRLIESSRGNPNVQSRELPIIDQLSKARDEHARLFVGVALEGQPFNAARFAASENKERILAEALSSGNGTYTGSVHASYSLDTLRKAVPAQTAFIDFVAWDRSDRNGQVPPHREYGAFVLSHGQPLRYIKIGAVEEIDSEIATLESGVITSHVRAAARVEDPARAMTPAKDVQRRLSSLYQKIIAPLVPSLKDVTNLWMVPDGKLSLVPIAGFVDSNGHYLLESFAISYLSSWRDLVHAGPRINGKTSPSVIVANPDFNLSLESSPQSSPSPIASGHISFEALPGAEQEADDITKTLQISSDRVLVGKMARKWVIQSLTAPQVLHFATHSVPYLQWKSPVSALDLFEFPAPLLTEDPLLQSVIALAGANIPQTGQEDGFLTGLEVASLHLTGTELVVLSTCESGQGVPVDGQGVLGLRAAFSIAGADSLVMSLWPVDDQAGRQFMKFFYSHLDAGPAAAVRLAQIDLFTKTEYKHPYYWAGYAASGDSRPVRIAPPDNQQAAGTAKQSVATPTCFEVSSHSGPATFTQLETVRIKIGGIVRRLQESADQVTFDLKGSGNELEEMHSVKINGFPVKNSTEVRLASQLDWSVTLTIEKHNDESSLTVRFGPAGALRNVLLLKGNTTLFPSFEIPQNLPPLSAYSAASGSDGGTIDRLGTCGLESLQ